jgi:hypothetical protein
MQVLAIAIWINNHNLVVNVTSQELTLAASLKVSNCVLGLSPFMWNFPVATVHILAKNNIISLPLPFMYARSGFPHLTDFPLGVPNRVRPLADPSNLCYYRD